MSDACTVTVAAAGPTGHLVNVDLSYLSHLEIEGLDAKLPRDHIRRTSTGYPWPPTWLEALGAHVWVHLGMSLVKSYQEQPYKTGLTFYVTEGADAHQVKARIQDFLELPCYGIRVERTKRATVRV